MVSNKWKRAAIGAAGIYTELILAAICTLVWWSTEPGLVHYLCLSTMTVCSVATLIFNANPLLRYDGYYILSDLIEIPNLARVARNTLLTIIGNVFREIPEPVVLPARHHRIFLFYAIAAPIYRSFVVVAILWFLSEVFEPYGLKSVGRLLIAVSLVGIVAVPIWQLMRYLFLDGKIEHMKSSRIAAAGAVLAAIALFVAVVPMPRSIEAAALIRHRNAERVYVTVPGQLASAGSQSSVQSGDVLVRLENPEIEFEVTKMEGRLRRLRTELRNLKRQQSDAPSVVQRIPPVEESIIGLEQRLHQLQKDRDLLSVKSPADGVVIGMHSGPPLPDVTDGLPRQQGSLFSDRNLGAWVERGDLVCQIGQPDDFEVVLIVEQAAIDKVAIGQSVRVRLDEYPAATLNGEVSDVSSAALDSVPPEVSARCGGLIQTQPAPSGAPQPSTRSSQVVSTFSKQLPDVRLTAGMRGRARIRLNDESIGGRMIRYLQNAIQFRRAQ